MRNHTVQRLKNIIEIVCIAVLSLASVVLEFIPISYLKDGLKNALLSKLIQQLCGGGAAILIMLRLKIKLFGRPQNLLFLIPCFIIAIDNFQFYSFFSGNMQLVNTYPWDILLFIGFFDRCYY